MSYHAFGDNNKCPLHDASVWTMYAGLRHHILQDPGPMIGHTISDSTAVVQSELMEWNQPPLQQADVPHLLTILGFLSAATAVGSPLRRWRFAAQAAEMVRPSWRSSLAAALRCAPHGLCVRVYD